MKPKELRNKLTIKKQTITNLDDKQQDALRGGVDRGTSVILCIYHSECNETECWGECPTYCGSNIDCSC